MSWWRWDARRLLAPAVFAWMLSSPAGAASPREVTLSGNIVYTRDQVIGELDANGARVTDVTIASGTRIRISGGHSLNIQARTLTITGEGPVILDGKGEPGLPGAAQTTEPAQQVSPLACSDNSAIHISTSDEYRGLPGDAGGAGAKGANVEIAADTLRVVGGTADLATFRSFFQVNVEGGEGGPGGQGGPGRLLTCDTDPTLQRRGPSGFSGAPGQRGANGAFTLQGEPEPAAVGVAVTISGGISLGSYEAGYNWALVRYIKSRGAAGRKPNDPAPLALVGVTGASAGSINTMLTAVAYCQTAAVDRAESPFDNIFYKAWVPVGLHVLLPADATRYEDADAVLSRKAFEQAERALTEAVSKKGNYVPGSCTLPVGMTVTRREPIELKGSGLQAPVDRFSIALEARTSAQGLEMHDLQR
ncbi:MAG TPA: hypothetical protein VK447_09095, partial [Myxococcaceae bacterium]|nr:hypothetical protein [Myxococcaceae bacterium]